MVERDRKVPERERVGDNDAREVRDLSAELQGLAERTKGVVEVAKSHLGLAHVHHLERAGAIVESGNVLVPHLELFARATELRVGIGQLSEGCRGPRMVGSHGDGRGEHRHDATVLLELSVDDAEIEAQAHVDRQERRRRPRAGRGPLRRGACPHPAPRRGLEAGAGRSRGASSEPPAPGRGRRPIPTGACRRGRSRRRREARARS